ncbi:MAG: single-stranded-DNA-specific exonuclease RecJ, partial [Holosporales bacterium]|nr:single-stranded-DNA-specific exonuclease RecJ [Holosporales bacterium]
AQLELFKRELEINDIAAKILINRGFLDLKEVDSFFKVKLKNIIPEPSLFLDMDKGVDRLIKAIMAQQRIMVFGDYDIDGITSTYLVIEYLRLIGIKAFYKIPNRFLDCYGLSEKIVLEAVQHKIDLLITVDCGTGSIDEVAIAKRHGIDVVIIDHHAQTKNTLPSAVAVINPNRPDQEEIEYSGIKCLCAVGVAFIFIIALQRRLKEIGFFSDKDIPKLDKFMDIIALGTLCDSVRLIGINRAVVKYCLNNKIQTNGILALMKAFNIQEIHSPDDFLYYIGPAINAAGRLGDPTLALNLFLEDDPDKSLRIANSLIELNKERRVIEKQAISDALAMISEIKIKPNSGICIFKNGWNDGIIGIISGRLKDKFNRPVFVISFNKDGIGRGSSRSIQGFHIGQFFEKARAENIIIDGGGHALAGGFSIYKDKIQDFIEFMHCNIQCDFTNNLDIDYVLSANSDLEKIYKEFSILAPFGAGIESPIFVIKRARIKCIKNSRLGTSLMLLLSDEFGNGRISAVIFGISNKMKFIESIQKNKDNVIDIAGRLSINRHGNKFVIEDARLSI